MSALGDCAADAEGRVARSMLLSAHVEIMLAADDVPAARRSADELTRIAGDFGSLFLRSIAAYATGAVLLAEGDAHGAGDALRRAWSGWQEMDVPYEAARVRVLLGPRLPTA